MSNIYNEDLIPRVSILFLKKTLRGIKCHSLQIKLPQPCWRTSRPSSVDDSQWRVRCREMGCRSQRCAQSSMKSHEARKRPKRNVGKEFTVDIPHHGPSTKWVVGISPTQHEIDMNRRFLNWTSKWPIFDHNKQILKNTLHPSFFTKPLFLIEFRKVLPVTGQLRKLRLDASGAIAPSSIGFSCKIGTDIWG